MVEIQELRKNFHTQTGDVPALKGVSLEIKQGEIFTMLGPSGCGKTTILRCMAGLERADAGKIIIGGEVVFDAATNVMVPAHERGIGMVFQSYAIWPHMSVFQNIALPLQEGTFKIAKSEVKSRVARALALVQLEGFMDRPATLLSGGQQQRVALARALVYEPKLLLLDEPLSNLDARLRADMRMELRELVEKLNITSLYVTHDQDEALALSDRIAVMEKGTILQVGSPRDIYMAPANDAVASFIGESNLVSVTVQSDADDEGYRRVNGSIGFILCKVPETIGIGETITVMFRPNDVRVMEESSSDVNTYKGNVKRTVYLGNRIRSEIQIGSTTVLAEIPSSSESEERQTVSVQIPPKHIRAFTC